MLLFLTDSTAFAQARPITPTGGKRIPPPIASPPGFSFIEGKFTLEVSATPTEVNVEDAIRLEIRLIGAGPKEGEPDRKHIRNLFPAAWDSDFYVQELRGEHKILRDEKTWLFVYRLKPKHVHVKAIDGIKLIYFDAAFGARGFITVPADRIPLTVKPKPEAPPDVKVDVAAAPESFYDAADSRDILTPRRTLPLPAPLEMALFLGLVPVLCLFGALAYRRLWPDEATVAERFRAAAAQRALARLRTGEPAWSAVERYLCERFDFTAADATPAEVADFLKRCGFAKALFEEARRFFQTCDGFRFTISDPVERTRLSDAAIRLIQALEADPCARA